MKRKTKIKRINISKVDHKVEDVHVEVKEEVPDVALKVVCTRICNRVHAVTVYGNQQSENSVKGSKEQQ